MKNKKGVLAIISMVIAGYAFSAQISDLKLQDRQKEILTQASAITFSLSTNCNSIARIMLPSVRKEWIQFLKQMKHDGKQFFLPDFFKVKYVMLGGYDATGYSIGLYNPFYDTFAIFLVNDKDKKMQVETFRIVTTATLCNESTSGVSPVLSTASPDEYFPALKKQVEKAQNAFYLRFNGKEFKDVIKEITPITLSEAQKLKEISKLRLGQALAIGSQKNIFADAVTVDLVIKGNNKGNIVMDGPSTKMTLETLSTKIPLFRKGFRVVAFFSTGKASNIIYFNPKLPTLLLHANISNGKVGLRMFDANIVNKQY